MPPHAQNTVANQIVEILLENDFVDAKFAAGIWDLDEKSAVAKLIDHVGEDEFRNALEQCVAAGVITVEQKDAILPNPSKPEAQASGVGKYPEATGRRLTAAEVEDLIKSGENLYRSVPGHLLPKDNNVVYLDYQLYRFIDSGASDLFLQTRKKNGLISYEIQFKIAWVNETQDASSFALPDASWSGTENAFFEMVRKRLGDDARINADLKHVMQDGSFSKSYRGKTRDFRLNSMPCRCYGKPYPRYAVRLTSEGDSIDFDEISMLPFTKAKYGKMIEGKVAGAIIVTWPTGSGKTTTIYGMLNKIDNEKNGVLSIEKPIESMLGGVFQTEEDSVPRDDPKEAYTLMHGLPGILRQALDVVFIGEMRNREEINGTIGAALVGNKLITTFHTNSVVDTFLRLEENGITRNAMGNAVKFITAQRLVPTLCPNCSRKDPDAARVLEELRRPFTRSRKFLESTISKHFQGESGIGDMDDLFIAFDKHLRFLAEEDFEGILDAVRADEKGFMVSAKDGNLARYLILKSAGFPNRSERAEFERLCENADVRIAGDGCGYADGAKTCRKGYLSMRTGIYEVLELDKSVRRKIQDPSTRLVEFEDFLMDRWFVSLRMEGWFQVLSGTVSYADLKNTVDG